MTTNFQNNIRRAMKPRTVEELREKINKASEAIRTSDRPITLEDLGYGGPNDPTPDPKPQPGRSRA